MPPLFIFLLLSLFPLPLTTPLPTTQTTALFLLRRSLHNPLFLSTWNRSTPFCSLPQLTCSNSNSSITHITFSSPTPHSPPLPSSFSLSSLFTTLTHFGDLESLTLANLGLWGQIPEAVGKFGSLRILNLSRNWVNGSVPDSVGRLKNLERLDLSGNRLTGPVPDLSGLEGLKEVYFGWNGFGPEFPVFGGNVRVVVVRRNGFKGNLDLRNLRRIEWFDGSENAFFGRLPIGLFRIGSLRHLDLSRNDFGGAMPEGLSCGGSLEFVDLSGNRLVGDLPECLRENTTRMTVVYSGNCLGLGGSSSSLNSQRRSSYCNENPLAVAMPKEKKSGKDGGGGRSKLVFVLAILGGIVGGGIVMALVLLVVMKKTRKCCDQHVALPKKSVLKKDCVPTDPTGVVSKRHMAPEVRMGVLGLMPYRVFEMEELQEATNNFDVLNLLQESSQVQLYRGRIRDGSPVTIRYLKLKQKHSPQLLLQYMDVFLKLQHRHLVSILGHCIHILQDGSGTTAVYLVFEHVSNGTLRSHLTEWRKREMLKWPQRIAAVVGVARGIQFLHTVSVPGIFGNDLRIENILLDQTLTAKIHNYNLPMALRNKSNKVDEGFPFIALEEKDNQSYMKHGDKEDIYQLGLILLEVITGKPATNGSELESQKQQLQQILTENSTDLRGLTDPAIHGTFAYDSLRTAAEVALNCLSKDPSSRPSVDDILWNLQYSVQVQDE